MACTEYKCTLSDACLQQAKQELNEDPQNRMSAVQTLREWITSQPHLICRTDTEFLLKFLRTSKFSQLRARTMIEGYLALKVEMPQSYTNWDPLEPQVTRFFQEGVFIPLPGYLGNGQKVLIHSYGAYGRTFPETIDKDFKAAVARYWYMIMLYFSRDENVQVSGMVFVLDFTNCPLRALTMYSISEARDVVKFQGKVPGRFKAFLCFNPGTFADALITLFKPFISKKLYSRISLLGDNLEALYKRVPQHMLPVEYLPDDYSGPNAGTTEQLRQSFYAEITSADSLAFLREESDPRWRIDANRKLRDAPSDSFRKLVID